MRKCTPLFFAAAFTLATALLLPPSVWAGQEFDVNMDISDGKDGRPFAKWIQGIKDKPVDRVNVVVKKVSGGDDTFINIRFGEDGQTLDNSKRAHITNDEKQKVKFVVGGQSAGGKPLVINAYNGVVKIKRVIVQYKGD